MSGVREKVGMVAKIQSLLADVEPPSGWTVNDSGVCQYLEKDGKGPETVQVTFAPVWVSSLSRDVRRGGWGRVVHWFDHDGEHHQMALGAYLFHQQGNDLAMQLASLGVPIVPGREKKLMQYLAAYRPEKRTISAARTGWHGASFVLPDRIVNPPENEELVFQPQDLEAVGDAIHKRGTLEEWQEYVAARAESPELVFAICLGLAAPMHLHNNMASGGFHLYGTTSRGKTTALQAGASVWGNGADPAIASGEHVYLQRWNATQVGMEGTASAFNDLPLCIDEIGESDSRDAGRMIYQMASGTGRRRGTVTGGTRDRRTWRSCILSSGEVTIADHIADGGKPVRGGQAVRVVDIPIEEVFPSKQDADAMKTSCGRYYGTAGVALLESGGLKIQDLAEGSIGPALTPEAERVRARFALVAAAGELAIQRGVLPWTRGVAREACKELYARWRLADNTMTDEERGLESVRTYIQRHPDRFERDTVNRDIRDRAGVYRRMGGAGYYHFFPRVFCEACGGVDADVVKKALDRRGLLHKNEGNRLMSQVRVDGKKQRMVSVDESLLESESTVETNSGYTGYTGDKSEGDRESAVPGWDRGPETTGTQRIPVPAAPGDGEQSGTPNSCADRDAYPVTPASPREISDSNMEEF